jgi:hypothetical protein
MNDKAKFEVMEAQKGQILLWKPRKDGYFCIGNYAVLKLHLKTFKITFDQNKYKH